MCMFDDSALNPDINKLVREINKQKRAAKKQQKELDALLVAATYPWSADNTKAAF